MKQVKSGVARKNALHGGSNRVRCPISWVILKHGKGVVPEWGDRGKELWLASATCFFSCTELPNVLRQEWGDRGKELWLKSAMFYFFMCRASERFAASNEKIHFTTSEVGLTRGDVRFFLRSTVVTEPVLWRLANRIEV